MEYAPGRAGQADFQVQSSKSAGSKILQQYQLIPGKSRQGGPLFHLDYMKHVPLMRLKRIKNDVISISCTISET